MHLQNQGFIHKIRSVRRGGGWTDRDEGVTREGGRPDRDVMEGFQNEAEKNRFKTFKFCQKYN